MKYLLLFFPALQVERWAGCPARWNFPSLEPSPAKL